MHIPLSIQTFVTTRLAEIAAAIEPLINERDELQRWMDAETEPTVYVKATPVVKAADTTTVTALLAAPSPSFKRDRPAMPIRLNGKDRPRRVRMNTTDVTEYNFLGNSYRCIANALSMGTSDNMGVWLTVNEWLIVRDVKSKEDAARKVRPSPTNAR